MECFGAVHMAVELSTTFGVTRPVWEALTWVEGFLEVLSMTSTSSTTQFNQIKSRTFYESSALENHEK